MADLKFLENLKFIRFGPGMVGKATAAYFALVAGSAALGWVANDLVFRYVTLGMIGAGFLAYLGASIYVVEKYPGAALMEGREAVRYHELQAETKGRIVGAIPGAEELTSSPERAALPPPEAALPSDVTDAVFHD